jgi:hypothetical protein
MVGYDTKYERDQQDEGYTLSVFMHWDDNENPPKNKREALLRLRNTIKTMETIILPKLEKGDDNVIPFSVFPQLQKKLKRKKKNG